MKRIFTIASGMILLASLSAFAVDPQRSFNGWGATVTASSTQAVIVIEQPAGDNIISNGTFTNALSWTTDATWQVTGGTGKWITAGVTTGSMYQVISSLTSGKTYRVQYTLLMSGAAGTMQAKVGDSVGPAHSASGTYVDDLRYDSSTNGLTLSFVGISTGISTGFVNTVTVRETPQNAFAEFAIFKIKPTDPAVYVGWDCPASVFTNIYDTSRALLVDSNATVIIDRNNCSVPLHRIWYRTAAGSATLNINAH